MLSTAAMVRLGYVRSNLMVNVRATNAKLRARAERILAAITGLDGAAARAALRAAGGDLRAALATAARGNGGAQARVRRRPAQTGNRAR
jgi:N-acetylmuramic acid 6-phosphate etherase